MDFVSGALWHFTAYSLMSHQFISLFINTLNAKMISESMWLLHAQPLSPFLPIPLQTKGPSPLAMGPSTWILFLTIAHPATLLFMGVGLLVFYTLCRSEPWRRNHIHERLNLSVGLKCREPAPKEPCTHAGCSPHSSVRYLGCPHQSPPPPPVPGCLPGQVRALSPHFYLACCCGGQTALSQGWGTSTHFQHGRSPTRQLRAPAWPATKFIGML